MFLSPENTVMYGVLEGKLSVAEFNFTLSTNKSTPRASGEACVTMILAKVGVGVGVGVGVAVGTMTCTVASSSGLAEVRSPAAGPAKLEPPSLADWPKLTYAPTNARRVDLAAVTRAEVANWKPGEVLLLNGKLLTGRDAAHKRMTDMLSVAQ